MGHQLIQVGKIIAQLMGRIIITMATVVGATGQCLGVVRTMQIDARHIANAIEYNECLNVQ